MVSIKQRERSQRRMKEWRAKNEAKEKKQTQRPKKKTKKPKEQTPKAIGTPDATTNAPVPTRKVTLVSATVAKKKRGDKKVVKAKVEEKLKKKKAEEKIKALEEENRRLRKVTKKQSGQIKMWKSRHRDQTDREVYRQQGRAKRRVHVEKPELWRDTAPPKGGHKTDEWGLNPIIRVEIPQPKPISPKALPPPTPRKEGKFPFWVTTSLVEMRQVTRTRSSDLPAHFNGNKPRNKRKSKPKRKPKSKEIIEEEPEGEAELEAVEEPEREVETAEEVQEEESEEDIERLQIVVEEDLD